MEPFHRSKSKLRNRGLNQAIFCLQVFYKSDCSCEINTELNQIHKALQLHYDLKAKFNTNHVNAIEYTGWGCP